MRDMLFKGNSSRLELLIEKIQANKENHTEQDIKEALGTEGGSSWGSEGQTSPSSSCATPNSATDLPDAELSFTVGVTEGTPYACQFCDKAFPRLSYLKKHEQTHSDHMPFRCEFCSRLFKHKRSRDRHIKLHTGDKKYRCTQCEAAFSRSDHLKIHMKTHDNQKPFQCTVCNRGYNTAAALTSHMQNHKKSSEPPSPSPPGNTFKCLQCAEFFRKPEDLQGHMATHHHVERTCTPPATPRSASRLHLSPSFPSPRLACMYCTKDNFNTMEALHLHVQAMHGSILNGDLQRELVALRQTTQLLSSPPSHTVAGSILPYSCELCTMRFGSVSALQKHALSVHGFPRSKDPLYCLQCALPFPTPQLFAEHYVLLHGGAGLFSPHGLAEQLKPTDLSKKPSPRPTPTPHDDRPPSSKRFRHSENGHSSANGVDNSRSPSMLRQYEHPGTLLCNQCNAALPDFESFRSHVKSHIEEAGGLRGLLGGAGSLVGEPRKSPSLQCSHCGAHYSNQDELAQHISTHFLATDIEYSCQSCMKAFSKPDELQKHLMDIHAHHLYRCALCKEMFDSKVAIQVHFAVKHSNESKMYRCTACPSNTVFHSEQEFKLHIVNIHVPQRPEPKPPVAPPAQMVRCLFCRMSFSSELEMQFHLAVHTKQFRCPLCPETFHVEFLLDKHIQTHHTSQVINGEESDQKQSVSGSKNNIPSSCASITLNGPSSGRGSVSGNQPVDTGAVKKSEYTNNNNNNPSACDICERSDFTSEAELAAHRKLVHHLKSSTGSKVSLHCAYCSESCKSRTELENHMKTHSQGGSASGKHKCNICDEICPSAAILAEHKLTHCKVINGSSCTQCKSSIINEEQYFVHMRQHSGSTPTSSAGRVSPSQMQLMLPTACVICRQTLVSEMEARIHARFHLHQSETTQCCVCLQGCDRRDLIGGICKECYSKHGKATPTRCPECQLKFETGPALEAHLSTVHRKTYQCIKCQLSFENEREIQLHVASHLLTEGNGTGHECRLCLRMLATPFQLQTHLIEHTFAGCPTFTCYLCSAVFTTAQGLQAHMLEHGLAARPYDCPRCSLRFFFRAELDNHSYTHLDEESSDEQNKTSPYYQPHNKVQSAESSPVSSGNGIDLYGQNDSNKQTCKQLKKTNNFKCAECDKELGSAVGLQAHMRHHRKPSISSTPDDNNIKVSLETLSVIPDSQTENENEIKQEIKEEAVDEDEHIDVEDQSVSTTDNINRTEENL
ncbi:zinc finger protein 423 homolog [Lycorma delicatula]|uniref:zinc finger protein 423 homolog n=1 Tax=Lycorma delicatula TaxID=130591 RepID=UPI003F51A760